MTMHELKTWPTPFQAILNGKKNYELRVNDRDFAVGDVLVLKEYDPDTDAYSGRELRTEVRYMTKGGDWGLPNHLCVMSLGPPTLAKGPVSI